MSRFQTWGWVAVCTLVVSGGIAARALDKALLSDLQAKASAGRCDVVIAELAKVKNVDRDIDALLLAGNCNLQIGMQRSQQFDEDGFTRHRIASGLETYPRAEATLFMRQTLIGDPAARQRGLDAFARALSLAPKRTDIIVGNVAALADAEQVDEALALLDKHKAQLDETARVDLNRSVQDLVRQQRLIDARRMAEAIDRSSPNSPAGASALGIAAAAQRDARTALIAFRRSVAGTKPTAAQARELANLLILTRDWEGAREVLAAAAPDNADLLLPLGITSERINPRSGVAVWKALRDKLPKEGEVDARLLNVLDHYRRLGEAKTLPTPVMRLRSGREFGKAGLLHPALAEYDRALFEDPKLVEGYKLMADLYRQEGRFELALEAIERGLVVSQLPGVESPYNAGELQLLRARLLLGLGRDADALKAYDEAERGEQKAPFEQALAAIGAGQVERGRQLLEALAAGSDDLATAAKLKLQRMDAAATASSPAS